MENPEQWHRIKAILGEALELSPLERPTFLDGECGEDASLRAEVESLLAAHDESDGLSEHPSVEGFGDIAEELKTIGPYQLLKKIGQGGMGQVWLAEQKLPVRRQVALKLLAPGVYHPAGIQRFQSERQALAMMDHPFIAKVFDAGSTADGRPYFVMEFVAGQPITEYCDQHKLGLRRRLELFVQVCEGVQHAHRKAIIHRDLKPSNILVTEVDGKAVPRIIDFGIAKAVSAGPGEEHTLFTQAGALIGTPGYMSPEQIDLSGKDIDTRTDVYSLGVLLYVLLTGYMPFTSPQWQKKPIDEILRQIREEEPQRPSTRVEKTEGTTVEAAEARRTEPGQLAASLRGDLDWITLKALEKDRERRYDSPAALAADISSYLENKPILARPASVRYRVQKYVRRHRAGVGVAAGALALLIAFVVMQASQLRRITRERDRANRITDFMIKMFEVSQPSQSRGNSVTAREILDTASNDIDKGLAKDPELQAHLTEVMGRVYTSLGLYQKGGTLMERSLETRKRILGPRNPDTLLSMSTLAWNLQRQGNYVEAEKLQRAALEGQERTLGPENTDTLRTASDLCWTLYQLGKYAEAEKLFRQTLERERKVLGPSDTQTLVTMSTLAWEIAEQGRYPEAEKMESEALQLSRNALGPEDPQTQTAMNNLAGIYQWEGRYTDAERLYRELIELDKRVRGAEHPDTLITMNNLGSVLAYENKFEEAVKLQEETLATQQRVLGPEHRDSLITMSSLAISLGDMGRFDEAESLLSQARAIQTRVYGPDNPRTADTIYNMACVATKRGKFDDAFAYLKEALAHGLSPAEALGIESDPDLKPLHDDPRFAVLVASAKQR